MTRNGSDGSMSPIEFLTEYDTRKMRYASNKRFVLFAKRNTRIRIFVEKDRFERIYTCIYPVDTRTYTDFDRRCRHSIVN